MEQRTIGWAANVIGRAAGGGDVCVDDDPGVNRFPSSSSSLRPKAEVRETRVEVEPFVVGVVVFVRRDVVSLSP